MNTLVKSMLLLAAVFSLLLASCADPGNPGNPGNGNGSGNPGSPGKANLKITVGHPEVAGSISRSIISNEYEVISVDIIIADEAGSVVKEVTWTKDLGQKVYHFELELNKPYNLSAKNYYVDNKGVKKFVEDGPVAFTIRPGYIREFTIIPTGAAVSIEPGTGTGDSGPALYIMGFQPSYSSPLADQGGTWIDIVVADAAKLKKLGVWKLQTANHKYVNLQMTSTDIAAFNLEDGQVIRVHGNKYAGTTDTAIDDNNSGIWDYKSAAKYNINHQYGLVWLEDESGEVIDLVAYTTSKNTKGYWISGTVSPAMLQKAVDNKMWDGTALADAFDLGDTNTAYAVLADTAKEGNAKADWVQKAPVSGSTVSGKVVLDGAALGNVRVELIGSSSVNTLTGADGTFLLEGVKDGTYTVRAALAGHTVFPHSYSNRLTVAGANITGYDFTAVNFLAKSISAIQGASHKSPLSGSSVTAVLGVVTAKDSKGFYLQSVQPDNDAATSEGVYVFTKTAPSVAVGDIVSVGGKVSEYIPGGTKTGNLSITQITGPTITSHGSGYALPAPVVLGNGGRAIPNKIICDDAVSNVDDSIFDPTSDGIDFYESLEGMLVTVNNAVVVGPKNKYGEIAVVADNGANASVRTDRGGIIISETDYNPEVIRIDDFITPNPPEVNVGALFSQPVTGVVSYSFGYPKIYNTAALPAFTNNSLTKEVTTLTGTTQALTVATYNVENLSAVDPAGRFTAIASEVLDNLATPDIIGLVEVMDNNGTGKGVTDASLTYQKIIDAITAAGGPVYSFTDIAPVEGADGGIPGGNIRCGFIYNAARVTFVERAGGTATDAVTVSNVGGKAEVSFSPGRISPASFNGSRKPLVGEFTFNGEKVYVVVNHFKSKYGDTPLFGYKQPPFLGSEAKRNPQAKAVADFVKEVLAIEAAANVVVLGDMNDFEFSAPLKQLEAAGLYNLHYNLPKADRYTYIYQGNSQVLDHIYVSSNLKNLPACDFDVVHINSEFVNTGRTSDHDPLIARFGFK